LSQAFLLFLFSHRSSLNEILCLLSRSEEYLLQQPRC